MPEYKSPHFTHPVRHSLLLSLIAAMTALSALPAGAQLAAENRVPRVVMNVLVDQLRSDYMQAFAPLYGDDGLRRLLQEGRIYTYADVPHAGMDRATSAATLATGSVPADHGIVGLEWLERETLRPVSCVDDADAQTVGALFSPGWRLKNSISQQLQREGFVPFSILFLGSGVAAGTINTLVSIDHIAPTLCEAIRIRAPNACSEKSLILS